MNRRKVASLSLATVLAAAAVVTGTSASQADITVNPGTPYEYVLGPGGVVVKPPTATRPKPVVVNDSSGIVRGFKINGTYSVTWSATNPENRSEVVSKSGSITLAITKLTTDYTGATFGDGTATGNLGEGDVFGTVKVKVTKDGVLDTVLVNVDDTPGIEKYSVYYGFGDLRCTSCVKVTDGALTQFTQSFYRQVPRADGKGSTSFLGSFVAERTAG